ncbi:hypothetical protein [Kitasatospora cheerisanensis]|uniref:Uncharacterized protein n=1 Tax=Kitasatospora cheerisanensis KCTC 2395 TaxID=1348663 RepID=A0A066YMC3_9ACTN|nr:hypothetical protein [Kitasatospora cheerisanensis]KDN82633.1 hypothetical protein KCH_55480 [Kitasatospora cheerisanensis KCTC 2395]
MTRLRTAAAAVLALSLAGLLAPAPAVAVERPRQHPRSAPDQRLTPAERQVNAFFAQYREDVLNGDLDGARQVREQYLTADLNARLDQWAAENDADPVFRAQNVPTGWSVTQGDSGAGHTTVLLTEQWDDGSTVPVDYRLRLPDLTIDDLENAPA